MAVTYDSSAKQTVGGTSTVVGVCTFTVAANACLVVGVNTGTNISISACAVNGTLLTQLGTVLNDASGIRATLFGIANCPSGVVSISANMVGGVAATICIGGASYTGADPTNPFGTVQSGTADAVATFALSLSTSTTHRVIIFGSANQNLTLSNVTTRMTDGQHKIYRFGDTSGSSNAISLSASCVAAGQNVAFLGLNIIDTAAAALIAGSLSLMGAGL